MSGLVLNAEQLTRQLESTNKAIYDLHDKFDHYEKTLCEVVWSLVREYMRSMIFEEWKKEHIENAIDNQFKDKIDRIVYEANDKINGIINQSAQGIKKDIKHDLIQEAVEETLRIICRKLED
jgi:hypothetical protein